ncbi:ImmA/IrrE family metallo-endopeptidase [Lentibacillus amyloliquefaciens]|uniref:IrrE N-terminal-like domain-containing protein n=1 Tax=Lentibacillus amyloliquefaciens TaxID=1472767 RepID=A0A0U3NL16_9BACI|nr:ImmA/IrrE family metallo-endopeptidase [Lentibacillus amyloliquefaciens]ALX47483.1 hypothetical protein AOX59_02020 [Lentibacillus amyloliquefaciens]
MIYTNTLLEDAIEELYLYVGIRDPDYSVEEMADKLGIVILDYKLPFSIPGHIFLNPQLSKEKKKELFAHELSHDLYHVGLQINMPMDFRNLQEWQARNFALHFCIPTFMLKKMELPNNRAAASAKIAETFHVTYPFAYKRLKQYEKRIVEAWFHDYLINSINNKTTYF